MLGKVSDWHHHLMPTVAQADKVLVHVSAVCVLCVVCMRVCVNLCVCTGVSEYVYVCVE